jgi:hypothetical protein
MKKPTVRGPSPSRKAHLVLRNKLNRKSKPAPPLPGRHAEHLESAGRGNPDHDKD